MLALIDADIVAYRVGFSCQRKGLDGELEVDPVEIAYARVDELMERIPLDIGATSYVAYLTGPNNFRLQYNPQYKANRTAAKPIHLPAIREYLVVRWNAVVTDGIEADDALGIHQMSNDDDTIICSIDKDLKQIPGKHYNFVKGEYEEVSYLQGLKFFYEQMLIGDSVDNIFGVEGIGKAKAPRIIQPCETELEMFEAVQSRYDSDERLLMNGVCLWIQRKPNEVWTFPDGAETYLPLGESEDSLSLQE